MDKSFTFSFEITPQLNNSIENMPAQFIQLCRKASFVSIADHGAKETQLALIKKLACLQVNIMPHIASRGINKTTLTTLLSDYQSLGIKQLLIISGDQQQATRNNFDDITVLINTIKQHHPQFKLFVAVNLEGNLTHNITTLQHKINAGADAAITQFFFNSNTYSTFMKKCRQQPITMPIIPGILPLLNPQRLQKISANCRVELPKQLLKRLDTTRSLAYMVNFCQDLLDMGVNHLHFFTINEWQLLNKILTKI
ncbi:MAG: methylenetetrahydrofolate reductase [Pseudomonadota bacterium]